MESGLTLPGEVTARKLLNLGLLCGASRLGNPWWHVRKPHVMILCRKAAAGPKKGLRLSCRATRETSRREFRGLPRRVCIMEKKEREYDDINHHQTSRASQTGPSRGRVSQFLLFAAGFLRHPNMVGWVLPSSPFLVEEVLKKVDWERARVIVEYGPGVGAFTTRVLQRMRSDAKLIALEINAEFVRFLKDSIKDPRLHLVQESATEIDAILRRLGCGPADYIISGIPFKTLPEALRHTIVRKTHDVLHPNGTFLVYQFSDVVRPYLERVFRKVSPGFELLNIIPARLFFCAR